MMSKRKVQQEEEEPAAKIAPIFLPQSRGVWKIVPDQLFIYTVEGTENHSKIAGFDLDGTLIRTKSGHTFAKDMNDWQLWSNKVVGTMRKYHDEGFKLCIFTNQKGIQLKRVDPGQFKRKIQNICTAIGLPIQVFVSIGTPNFRKPYTGMWERMESHENGGVPVERRESLYIGDAAGRVNDHSCADRLFALNLSVKFFTPEQFFAREPLTESYKLPEFDPSRLLHSTQQFDPPDTQLPDSAEPELVLLVGPPASGKSTFARRFRRHYAIVNQDELGTWKACVGSAGELLRKNGKSVIVDNTNRNMETRKRFCDLAVSLSVPCRCLIFNCSPAQAIHNNTFRQIIGADASHKKVNEIAIRTFFSAYQEPSPDEGYRDIVHVNFVPDFENDEHRRIYGMYLAEK